MAFYQCVGGWLRFVALSLFFSSFLHFIIIIIILFLKYGLGFGGCDELWMGNNLKVVFVFHRVSLGGLGVVSVRIERFVVVQPTEDCRLSSLDS